MKRPIVLLLLVVTLVACGKKEESIGASQAPTSQSTEESAKNFLAYEHQITIDTEENQVATAFKAGVAACSATPKSGCVVLDSSLNTGKHTSASIKMRVSPGLVKRLIESMSHFGEVTNQSTTAEDLALPISDTKKKLEMLTSYRSKLEALQAKSTTDVDSAIKITKELAQVQSDIEALSGQQAHLMQRVNTELLTVSIESAYQRAFLGPIRASISEFTANLSQGIATTITGLAFLFPWVIAISLFAWPVRRFWLKSKRNH